MGTKLYVGNLSYDTVEGDLLRHLEQAGNVVSCNMIIDKMTNKSKGFGFVEMGSQDEANKAISMFNGKDLHGRKLIINEARPREDRNSGGGGGGGGRDYRSSGGNNRYR